MCNHGHHHHHDANHGSISVNTYRIISIFALFVLALVGGLLPYFVRGNPRLLDILNCTAAGVFIAAGFMHLLHSASHNEAVAEWSTIDDGKYAFPWPQFFCTIGFLATFYIEQFALCLQEKKTESSVEDKRESSMSPDVDFRESALEQKNGESNLADTAVGVVIYIALSFHSILEGIGIGAQPEAEWGIFLAVALHKGLAAFALGAKIFQASKKMTVFLVAMIAFALTAVIGILIGWALACDHSGVGTGIAVGLSSGTFIFVAFMELIPDAFGKRKDILMKCIALFLGYAIFGGLAKWC